MQKEVSELTNKEMSDLVRDLIEAGDGYYKAEVLDQHGFFDEHERVIWELIAGEDYPAWDDPGAWDWLASDSTIGMADGEVLVELLCNVRDEAVTDSSNEPSDLLADGWPIALDTIAMHAYARCPEQMDSRGSEISPGVSRGLDLVRARFGRLDPRDTPDEILETIAEKFLRGSLPDAVWDFVDGDLHKVSTYRASGEAFDRLRSHLIDDDRWARMVLEALGRLDYTPDVERTLDAWPAATLEEIQKILLESSSRDEFERLYRAFLQREDSASSLAAMARRLADAGRISNAEIVAVVSTLRALEDGKTPPQILDLIQFSAISAGLSGLEPLLEALAAFDEELVVERFEATFESELFSTRPLRAIAAVRNNQQTIDRALDILEATAVDNFSSTSGLLAGFVRLGESVLPRLVERLELAEDERVQYVYQRLILSILGTLHSFGPEYERFVSLVQLAEPDEIYEVSIQQHLRDSYWSALEAMPGDRAIERVRGELDASHAHWARAMCALPMMLHAGLAKKAFELVAEEGLTSSEVEAWFRPLFVDHFDELEPYLVETLRNLQSPELHDRVEEVLHWQKFEALLKATATTRASFDSAHRVQHYARRCFEAMPDVERETIYVLEATHEGDGDSTLNRLGGSPVGITEWPRNDDGPMMHMLSLDLDTMPRLREIVGDEARAVSLFVRGPDDNQGWSPDTEDTRVVIHTDDCAARIYEEELPLEHDPMRGIVVHEIEVPTSIFGNPPRDKSLARLREAVFGAEAWSRASQPLWLQGEDYHGACLLQFDSRFVPMNMGDNGVMYLFENTAFWQGH